jgi:uncharacterized protein YacL
MKNSLLLSINVGLLVSYALKYHCHGKIYEYEKDLTGDLLAKYEKIKKERMSHFIIGLIIAFIVSAMYFTHHLSEKTPTFEKINVVVLFMLILPIVIYKVLPKSDYMLKHSQSDQDYKDWFNIYLCMKNKCVYGFLAGFCLSMLVLSFTDIN